MATILLVDDDPLSLSGLEALVRAEGFEVETAIDLASARTSIERGAPMAVLADYFLPDGEGLQLAEACAAEGIELAIVTGRASVETAVEALRGGASDFLTKPVDAARLKVLLESMARAASTRKELDELRAKLREHGRFGPMVGASPAMQKVYDLVGKVAPTDATVLITGESGTGKELVAETVHRLSRRAHRPFVPVNCGAISANLIESELFGHEKGSFTGADRQRRGVFERAHQGTLFLDEIGEMPLDLQVRLLRVLESGSFSRIGGEKPIRVDVRVVAASNQDLAARAEAGEFREDLYYRIRVVPIELPPLRDRGDDVEALVRHFLDELASAEGVAKGITPEALEHVCGLDYPGNVRELRNLVHQAFILAGDEIGLEHLSSAPAAGRVASAGPGGGRRIEVRVPASLREVEREVVLATLEALGGDKKAAAETLGISLKTLYSRLREYGPPGG